MENTTTEFGFFDPSAGIEINYRKLPHWFQPNVVIFVTFRSADSMPISALQRLSKESNSWLRAQGVVCDTSKNKREGHKRPREGIIERGCSFDGVLHDSNDVPLGLRTAYHRFCEKRWHESLDACYGECLLRDRKCANIVMDALRSFDGERYDLDCAVIMPNHVHLLAQFHSPFTCRSQCASWLQYTARLLNDHLGRKGRFWQGEPFDHLVRSADHFARFRWYIEENGRRASLPESDYLLWCRS